MSEPDGPATETSSQRAGEFVRLFVRHERRLYAYLLTVLGNPADAEDVLQQTSIVLWKKFEEFTDGDFADGDFTAWGIKTAYFTAKNHLRKQRRSHVLFSQQMVEAVAEHAAASNAEVNEVHEKLGDCLEKLPPRDRELIERRYELEASVQAIARHFGCSIHQIYRALSRIHESLFDCVSFGLTGKDV